MAHHNKFLHWLIIQVNNPTLLEKFIINNFDKLYIILGAWDSAKFTIRELIQMAGAILEMSVLEPQVQIKGGVLIIDLSNMSMSLLWYLTPTLASDVINLAGVSINSCTILFLMFNIIFRALYLSYLPPFT